MHFSSTDIWHRARDFSVSPVRVFHASVIRRALNKHTEALLSKQARLNVSKGTLSPTGRAQTAKRSETKLSPLLWRLHSSPQQHFSSHSHYVHTQASPNAPTRASHLITTSPYLHRRWRASRTPGAASQSLFQWDMCWPTTAAVARSELDVCLTPERRKKEKTHTPPLLFDSPASLCRLARLRCWNARAHSLESATGEKQRGLSLSA